MAKNYFYNLLLSITNILFPILSFPYVSRILGPEGIGKVQFVYSFAQYFALVAAIGIPIYGMKEIARYRDDFEGRSKVFSELLVIYLLTSICLCAVYLVVISSFPFFNADRDMYLSAAGMVVLSFCYIEWLYTGMEQFKAVALRSVLFKLIGLVLMYLFIKERSDFRIYLYIMMFSFVGNNVLSFLMIKGKVKPVLKGLDLRKHIGPLLLILGTTFATSMYTEMDTVLLGLLSDTRTVGLYTAAVKLSKIAIPFVISMGVVLIPKIAKDFADHNLMEVQETLGKTFKFLAFFSIPVVAGLALLAPEFIALFSGAEFLPATSSMRLLSLLPMIIGFGHLFLCLVLIPSGRNREMLFCVICGMTMSLVLNVILIPHFKELGSSVANVSSEMLVTLLYFYFIRKHYSFTYDWKLLGKALFSVLFFIPLVWEVRELSLPLILTLIIAVSSCALSYFLIQWFVFRNDFILIAVDMAKLKFQKTNRQRRR